MKQRALVLVATLAAIVLGGPPRASARPLVIYSPHGSELLGAAQEAFAKVEKDAVIDWRFMSTEDVLTRLEGEKDKPVADLWWGGPQFTFLRGVKEGLLTPYKPSWASQSRPEFHDEKDSGRYIISQFRRYQEVEAYLHEHFEAGPPFPEEGGKA